MSSGFSENNGFCGVAHSFGLTKKICLLTGTIGPPIGPFQMGIKKTYLMQKCWNASLKYPKLIEHYC